METRRGRINKIDGTPPPHTNRARTYNPGFIHAIDAGGKPLIFWTENCRDYHIGDSIAVQITLLDT